MKNKILFTATFMFSFSAFGQAIGGIMKSNRNFRIPAAITFSEQTNFFISSVYDEDYLPFTLPTTTASTIVEMADGVNESTILNFQGTITTTGFTVFLPVTVTATATLPAFSSTITIPASLAEDGISRIVNLSWNSQSCTISTKSITATIKTIDGILNVKKLDLNSGIGNSSSGVLLANFLFSKNSLGETARFHLRIMPGIPDRMFGIADNNGLTDTHMMLYLPIIGEDGKTWLNNNLGAHYANLNHPNFNLAQQATSATDHLAYGSLIQWGRKTDGHELISYTSSTSGTVLNGFTSSLTDTPTNALFIVGNPDWRDTRDNTLWTNENSINNPCPNGFRVPTIAELNTLFTAAGITSISTGANSNLKFSIPGGRHHGTGDLINISTFSTYWSTTIPAAPNDNYASNKIIQSTGVGIGNSIRAFGFSVRCIKN